MEEALARAWEQLTGRITGPMWFRLLMQPAVAVVLAVRAGLRDAAANRPAYLWTVATNAAARRGLLRDGWQDVGRLCLVAFVLDTIYQLVVLRAFYPLQSLIVMVLLAVCPYVLVRGPVNRGARQMARTAHRGTFALVALLVLGVTTATAHIPKYGVKTKVNHDFDFSLVRTYCWTVGYPTYDKEIDRGIVAAVDGELAARGLTRLPAEPCDAIVTYASLQRIDIDLKSKPAPGSKLRRQYDVGTLVVMLKRPQSGIELFRGRLDAPLEPEPAKRMTQIVDAIARMFHDYPVERRDVADDRP